MSFFRNVGDVLKSLKRDHRSQIYCPRCGSAKIHTEAGLYKSLAPRKYKCEECGYNGPIIMELEKEEEHD